MRITRRMEGEGCKPYSWGRHRKQKVGRILRKYKGLFYGTLAVPRAKDARELPLEFQVVLLDASIYQTLVKFY